MNKQISKTFLSLLFLISMNLYCSQQQLTQNFKKSQSPSKQFKPTLLVTLATEISSELKQKEPRVVMLNEEIHKKLHLLERLLEQPTTDASELKKYVTFGSPYYVKEIATVYNEVQRAKNAEKPPEKSSVLSAAELKQKYVDIKNDLISLLDDNNNGEELEKHIINNITQFKNGGGIFKDNGYEEDQNLKLLYLAISLNNLPVLKALIEIGEISPNLQGISERFKEETPLIISIFSPNKKIYTYLLSIPSIDVNMRVPSGSTALSFAAALAHRDRANPIKRENYLNSIKSLIQAGADVEFLEPYRDQNQPNSYDSDIAALVDPAARLNPRGNQ